MPVLVLASFLAFSLQSVHSSREFRVVDSHGNTGVAMDVQSPELLNVANFVEPYDARGVARCCCDSVAPSDNSRRCKVFVGIEHCADAAGLSWVQGRLQHYNRVGDHSCNVPVEEENDVHREILSRFGPSNYCKDYRSPPASARRAPYNETTLVPVACSPGYRARFESATCGFHNASEGSFFPVPECVPIENFCRFQSPHLRPTKGDMVIVTSTGRVGEIDADFRDESPYIVRFGEEEVSDWLTEDEIAWPEAPPMLSAATGETVTPTCTSPGAVASGEVVCEGSGQFSPRPGCRWDTSYCASVERPYSGALSVPAVGLHQWADVTCGPGFVAEEARVHCSSGAAFMPEPRCSEAS